MCGPAHVVQRLAEEVGGGHFEALYKRMVGELSSLAELLLEKTFSAGDEVQNPPDGLILGFEDAVLFGPLWPWRFQL